MKRIIASVLAFVMTMSLASCITITNKDEDSSSKREIASVDKSSDNEAADSKSEPENNSKEDTDTDNSSDSETADSKSESENNSKVDTDTDNSSEEKPANVSFSVDEQVIWETDDVKLSITGVKENSIWGTEINVLAESKSNRDIAIGLDTLIINDYMIDGLFSVDITAGNKARDSITLFESELEAAGINNIGQIELYLYTYDPNSFETIDKSNCVTIKTSNFDAMDTTSSIEGVTVLDKNGIKIVAQYVDENSFWGQAVIVYVENNSGKNISVSCDDIAVNGFMVNGLMYQDVYAGKKAFTDITLFRTTLEENGITSIDTIETTFEVFDDDFNTIASSGKVKLNLK